MSDFLNDLDNWILEAVEKTAADEPTSHLSQGVDDGNSPATTGARASENESDVKAEVPGESIDEASASDVEGPGRGENTATNSIGTEAAPTGEDSSVETASVKGAPEDPGTAHPAKATMGEKYSAAELTSMGDTILADIAIATAAVAKSAEAKCEAPTVEVGVEAEVEAGGGKKKEDKKEDDEKSDDSKKASANEIAMAKEAGRQAAAAVVSELATSDGPQAQVSAEDILDDVVKQASIDAENSADYLAGFFSKLAMDAEDTGDTVMEETSDAGAMPPEMPMEGAPMGMEEAGMAAGPEEAGVTPEELLELAGGAGGEGEVPAEEAAMMPPMPEAGAEEAMLEEAAPKMAAAKAWTDKSMEQKCAELKVAIATVNSKQAAAGATKGA